MDRLACWKSHLSTLFETVASLSLDWIGLALASIGMTSRRHHLKYTVIAVRFHVLHLRTLDVAIKSLHMATLLGGASTISPA